MRPVKRRCLGKATRYQLRLVNAARRFDASISCETGMYFVVPVVVPDDNAT
jgi:hypothetical protein